MKKMILVFVLLASWKTFAVDVGGLHKIHETKNVTYYCEDYQDYHHLIDAVEQKNKTFQKIFEREISGIEIYIFSSQESFSKGVFGSDKPIQNATGFADHRKKYIYVTSYYDTCKPRTRLLQTPVHELIHLFFPSGFIWIREGIACYYAEMLTELNRDELPNGFIDIHFYTHGPEENRKAYMASGWLVKYIIEVLCQSDMDQFRTYSAHPDRYETIGVSGESDLFRRWKEYMIAQSVTDTLTAD